MSLAVAALTVDVKDKIKDQLRHLLASFRRRQAEYDKASTRLRGFAGALTDSEREYRRLESNRYEGLATASRWAAEDLENLINEL